MGHKAILFRQVELEFPRGALIVHDGPRSCFSSFLISGIIHILQLFFPNLIFVVVDLRIISGDKDVLIVSNALLIFVVRNVNITQDLFIHDGDDALDRV